ncbi:MAG: ComEC/Rec2 family competence protein, partial [Chloroflexota bacterium]
PAKIIRSGPPIAIAGLLIFLGATRYQAAQPLITPAFIANYNDDQIEYLITGMVTKLPDQRDSYINLTINTEKIRPDESIFHSSVEGILLVKAPTDGQWHYGDRVVVRGKLGTPPSDEQFSYQEYLARQGIHSFMPYGEVSLIESQQGNIIYAAIFKFKERALAKAYQIFPDPEASLIAGILLGVESGIPVNVKQSFQDTGTTHVIAISGFNITIIAGLAITVFSKLFGRNRGVFFAGLTIAIYTLLVGADAAVVRAAVMGGIALTAKQLGRRQDGLRTLIFTAFLMAVINPFVLWDVGFQLSFAATAGLILYADRMKEWFVRWTSHRLSEDAVTRLSGPVTEYFLFTIAAQITTLPIIVYHFQRFSLSSLPANFAILPAQPPIMLLGGAAVLSGMLIPGLGQFIAYLAWPFAGFTIRIVEWFAGFSGGVIVLGKTSWILVLIYFVALILITERWQMVKDFFNTSMQPKLVAGSLAILTFLVWQAALSAPDGLLHITLLDVGTGDAVLIRTPDGRYGLINGGPSATRLSEGIGRRLPAYHRQLDFLLVASPTENQTASLATLVERFPPQLTLWTGPPNA